MTKAYDTIAIFEILPGVYAGCRVEDWDSDGWARCPDTFEGRLMPVRKRENFCGLLKEQRGEPARSYAHDPERAERHFRKSLGIKPEVVIRRFADDAQIPPELFEGPFAYDRSVFIATDNLYLECPHLPTDEVVR